MDKEGIAGNKKKAHKQRAKIIYIDETGFSLIPLVGNTWAERGKTPVIKHRFSWPKLSVIYAVGTNMNIYSKLHPNTAIKSGHIVKFLCRILNRTRGKIFIIWDRIQIHRAKCVNNFIAGNSDRIEVFSLPAYAPELNAVEYMNSNVKFHKMKNFCPDNLKELMKEIRKSTNKVRYKPSLIKGFLKKVYIF